MIQQPNNSDEFIKWLFRDRCVICHAHANVVHEIIPRSAGKESMNWENRITLCNECHRQVHDKGIGDDEIFALQQGRIEFLEMIGRSEYA